MPTYTSVMKQSKYNKQNEKLRQVAAKHTETYDQLCSTVKKVNKNVYTRKSSDDKRSDDNRDILPRPE